MTSIILGRSSAGIESLDLRLANRHGLVTGATGTGKTVTLQVLAEAFSAAGVPVFAADIKGDLSGVSQMGRDSPAMAQRAASAGLDTWAPDAFPTVFWDIFGEQGHPVRATVRDMGPLLLSRLLELTPVQEGVMNIAFKWAADRRRHGRKVNDLVTLDHLRDVLGMVAERSQDLRVKYGNITSTSVGAIQRRLLVLEEQGAQHFFGEPWPTKTATNW